MAENKVNEIYEKIEEIGTAINNCEDLPDEKRGRLRRNIRSMLKIIDFPDSFYGARERLGNLMTVVVLALFAASAFLVQWIDSLWIIGAWILILLYRALYVPSLDDITLGIIKSGNHTLYRIFIKQNKQH